MRYSGNKILVPYKFASEGDYALEIGNYLAEVLQTELMVAHVMELPTYPNFDKKKATDFRSDLQEHISNELQKKIDLLVSDEIKVSQKILQGHPVQSLIDLTRGGEYGLAVMGYDQSENMNGRVSGSTVERTIRYANIPILTTRQPFASSDVGDIVFATDLMATPVFVMQNLTKLQNALQAKLHIVKVNTRENWITSREAQSQLEYFSGVHHLHNYEFATYDDISPEQGIVNYANDIHAGMIAMGIKDFTHVKTLVHHHHITEDVLKQTQQLLWTCTL